MIQPGLSALSFDNPLTGGTKPEEDEDDKRRRWVAGEGRGVGREIGKRQEVGDDEGGGSSEFAVNTTDVRERLKDVREVSGVAPRWITLGKLHSKSEPEKEVCLSLF